MQNIFDFNTKLKKFVQQEINSNYNLDIWAEMSAIERLGAQQNTSTTLFDTLIPSFELQAFTTAIQASRNAWDPCLMLKYSWHLDGFETTLTIILVKDNVQSASFDDMRSVLDHFGSGYDFVDKFDEIETYKSLTKNW